MITKDVKISKMLDRYPQTLNVLLSASPHFQKLNNRFLRKTLAGRVSVEQAAGIAGVRLDELLNKLNESINEGKELLNMIDSKVKMLEDDKGNGFNSKPEFLNLISGNMIKILDVRKDIAEGNDPLLKILKVVKELKDSEAIHLINSFEPVPLYSVLKKKGLEHWTEKIENIYHAYFYRETGNEKINKEGLEITPDSRVDNGINNEDKIIELDVRELEPPQPMIEILETLSKMDADTVLLVHHHREPFMLYEKLEERGFQASSNKITDNYFKIVITKKKQ